MPQFQAGALPRRKAKKPKSTDEGKAEANTALADSDVEEADITALARASLKEGEVILGEGADHHADGGLVDLEVSEKRGICNAPALLQKLSDIEYKVPEGAKRVPWVDTLAIEDQQTLPGDVKSKDGVKLESTFVGLATNAVKEAYRRLKVMKIPCSRPSDFYAEMLRSDQQMYRVRAKATEEQRRIKIVEDRKKAQASKKFAKKARSKKLEARAEEKRQTLEDIKAWRKRSRDDAGVDVGDVLDKQGKGKGKGDDAKGKGKGKNKKSKKRLAKDEKFGFGGKKKRSRQNDSKSVNDMSSAPWARKGKGKGKGGGGKGDGKGGGKGGGGKGKGKGKDRGGKGGGKGKGAGGPGAPTKRRRK